MIERVDQLRLVSRLMIEAAPKRDTVPEGLHQCVVHFLTIESCVTSILLILLRDPANYVEKAEPWDATDACSSAIGRGMRSQLISHMLNLSDRTGCWIVYDDYLIVERIVGFN